MSSHLLPSDADWLDDNGLWPTCRISTRKSRVIFSPNWTLTPAAPSLSEWTTNAPFGHQLIELGKRVQERAATRALQASSNGQTIEGPPPTAIDP